MFLFFLIVVNQYTDLQAFIMWHIYTVLQATQIEDAKYTWTVSNFNRLQEKVNLS